MDKEASQKLWRITLERSSGLIEAYCVEAETLHKAFIKFNEAFSPYSMVGLHIVEAK